MATTACRRCKAQVSMSAMACPRCGAYHPYSGKVARGVGGFFGRLPRALFLVTALCFLYFMYVLYFLWGFFRR